LIFDFDLPLKNGSCAPVLAYVGAVLSSFTMSYSDGYSVVDIGRAQDVTARISVIGLVVCSRQHVYSSFH